MPRPILIALLLVAPSAFAQAPTMKQLMLDLIHPASNSILLASYRGGPADEKDWADLRHSALTLMESANLLAARGPAGLNTASSGQSSSTAWAASAKMLTDAAAAAYKAAQDRDPKALAALTVRIDASCTSCHKQYRPNVFPPGGSK
jgi:cytochrome c556